MKHWLITILLVSLSMSAAWARDSMKAFPPAEAGMVRHILQLPEQDDESAFKVELVVGKTG
jgi:ecotin